MTVFTHLLAQKENSHMSILSSSDCEELEPQQRELVCRGISVRTYRDVLVRGLVAPRGTSTHWIKRNFCGIICMQKYMFKSMNLIFPNKPSGKKL